jgi:MFS family permease
MELGWSYTKINTAITISLITWAMFAPFVGKLLYSKGARYVMSLGSFIASFGLFLWAIFPNFYTVFLFSWVLIGVSMSMVLYESAFAVITTTFQSSYKKGINILTIIGGLASTLFIPFIQYCIDALGFENTIWLLGLLHLTICLPLHLIFLPASNMGVPTNNTSQNLLTILKNDIIRQPAFSGLLIWFSTYAILTSGISFLLIPLLLHAGAEKENVIFMMALIGVMQVGGRVFFIFAKTEGNTRKLGYLLNGLFVTSMAFLLYSTHYYVLLMFALLYGSSKGIMSVIKGTATADLFSLQLYTRLNGVLSGITGVIKSVAPLLLSLVWTTYQAGDVVLYVLLIITLMGFLGIIKLKKKVGN